MTETTEAIAIQWADEDDIPFVSAIGEGIDAHAIVEAAIEAKVPILDNPLLMEEMMTLQKDQSIPEHLFLAVAQILAFVKFMEGKFNREG